ncbi:STAS domain-containing protein [Nonomuraea jiangxiensis]|uniref:STAS domain-containing protein n=1 Tax=Nonomuraea jiangxiensis TaxID=633440 RepID=A0A1G9B2N9_9ACTN|nr:STAS domain-containing protein [Nonomuraea jiangxiensis]SDK33819.1 hypothetical protein SAMN05421869_115137 [Nonomuraea jiangxiensis]
MNGPGPTRHEDDFDIRVRTRGHVVIIQLTGPLTETTGNILRMYLMGTLATQAPPALIVDIGDVSETGDFGREILRSATRHARESAGRLIITGGAPLLGGSPAGFDLLPSIGDALAAFGGP